MEGSEPERSSVVMASTAFDIVLSGLESPRAGGGSIALAQHEQNLARGTTLCRLHPSEAYQLEESEERDDHLRPTAEASQQDLKDDGTVREKHGLEPFDLLGDRHLFPRDLDRSRGARGIEHSP